MRRAHPLAASTIVALLASAAFAAPTANEVKRTLRQGDAGAVKGLLEGLAGSIDPEGVRAVLEVAGDAKDGQRLRTLGVYDALVGALAGAKGPALEELTKQLKKNRRPDIRFLIADALGKVGEAGAEAALLEALKEDDDESVAVLCARKLGAKATASAVEALIPLLADFEKQAGKGRLVREVNGALATLTGEDLTVAADWKNWWDSHKAEFRPKAAEGATGSQTQDKNALDKMRRERPADAKTMERLRPEDVQVVKGGSDQIERVLKNIKIPHVALDRDKFDELKLDPTRQVLILNCAGTKNLSDAGIQKVKEFVAAGGYLFSSDWELRNTLEKAFPEVCKFKGETPREPKEGIEVKIRPHAQSATHPYLRDVFPLGTWTAREFKWKLDSRSHLVEPNPAITILVESPDMEKMGSSTVAFTFAYPPGAGGRAVTGGGKGERRGGGQVLQVSSHLKNQEDAEGDGFALQQLLLNFIVEKQEARKSAKN